MRTSLMLLLVVIPLFYVSAQRGRGPALDGVWVEAQRGRSGRVIYPERPRTVLFMESNGFFEELRYRDYRATPDRRYAGRWSADYRTGTMTVTLGERGQGRVGATNRGRTYFPTSRRNGQRIRFRIVYSDRDEMVLRDRRTNRERVFLRERPGRGYYRR
ncbi:MAG: hypothetical protein AAGF89_09135 [Bacteroidota bacterium]